VNEWFDSAAGRALSFVGDLSISSFSAYRTLFTPPLFGATRDAIARLRARAVFWHARRSVPAYRQFLAENGAARPPRSFAEVPPTSKDSYIKGRRLESLCVGGRLPTRGAVLDESSGSSGTATNWVRGPSERAASGRLIQFSARARFGKAPFVLLNAFALGPWATGMHVSMSLVGRCILKSIGPDAKKVVASLKALGPEYRYVISGYPPFLKSLVESADLDFAPYDICAVVGGEGMSEPLREVLGRAFRKVYSSFGASDLEINLATENDATIGLRKRLAADPQLLRDVCGSADTLPMVFQYDPLNTWIETDDDGRMLFTLNRLENVSPRVRYDLGDRGVVRSFEAVRSVLRAHRSEELLAGGLPLPFLFHLGRFEHAVAFYGCKITPADAQAALLRIPEIAPWVAEHALHPYEDERADKRLEIWAELRPGAPELDAARLGATMIERLAEENQDFRESVRMIEERLRPALRLFPSGQSPLSGQDARIKRRYIV
jgi:phenylacetate-CoA ligase